MTLSHSRKRLWRILILVLVFVALITFHAAILQSMAIYLISEDPLGKAVAIVALRGQVPFRELEAAKYYREGFAPIVMLVPNKLREEAQELERLGVKVRQDWEYGREVLLKQGVPEAAIVIPKDEAIGTLEELQAVYKALVSQRSDVRDQRSAVRDQKSEVGDQRPALSKVEGSAGMPVILVTSKYHTRRTGLTWKYVTGGSSQAIVRAASGDPFDAERWWQQRSFVLSVVREYLGLINYYAGFPVAP